MFNFTALPPLSLYLHLPWCVRKCPYCDFNSHEARGEVPERAYIDALVADLEQDLPSIWGRPVETVFLGGGTPSLFTPDSFDRLFSQLRARLVLPAHAEITMEANPGTLEAGRFAEFRAAGINRLSIGVQSFDDAMLKKLGRIHGAREAIAAAEGAHAAGFDELNLDLMFGLPGQTVAQALADAGYLQYEVSAYARAGHRCRHNLNYWLFGDYLGIGAGAHAKISNAQHQRIVRTAKLRHPREYLDKAAPPARVASERILKRREAGFEFMLNALRLNEGFPIALFAQHTGLPLTVVEGPLRAAEQKGLIAWDLHQIRATELGWLFLNDLTALFLPED